MNKYKKLLKELMPWVEMLWKGKSPERGGDPWENFEELMHEIRQTLKGKN